MTKLKLKNGKGKSNIVKPYVSRSNFIPSGFNAFGKSVPTHRLMNGYKTVKEMMPDISNEKAFSIIAKISKHIEEDRPFDVLGNTSKEDAMGQWLKTGRIKNKELDTDLTMIDLTGRYRLLAVMMAG